MTELKTFVAVVLCCTNASQPARSLPFTSTVSGALPQLQGNQTDKLVSKTTKKGRSATFCSSLLPLCSPIEVTQRREPPAGKTNQLRLGCFWFFWFFLGSLYTSQRWQVSHRAPARPRNVSAHFIHTDCRYWGFLFPLPPRPLILLVAHKTTHCNKSLAVWTTDDHRKCFGTSWRQW